MVELTETFSKFGELSAETTQKILNQLSNAGINANLLQEKIILFLLVLIMLYVVIKIISIPKKLIKFGIIGLLIFLGISIVISL